MRRTTCLVALAALTTLVLAPRPDPAVATAGDDTVVVVHLVLDSLHPDEVGSLTPTLSALREQGTWYEQARAVMASETLPNHVAMATGTYPGTNGIPGNEGRAEPGDTAPADPDLGRPDLVEATSLVAAIETVCPDLRTVTAFSKGYVHRAFADDGADADYTARETEIPASGHVPDALIGSWVVQRLQEGGADHVFVNLGDVDRAGHVDASGSGVHAAARQAAIEQADTVVAGIVAALEQQGLWERTVLVIGSDHAMDHRAVEGAAGVDLQGALDDDARTAGRLFVSENGGAGLVYLTDPAAGDADEVLAAAREVLVGLPGIDEVLHREPNPLDPGHDLDAVHPDWRLAGTHRAGELFVTVQPGWAVGLNPMPGNHGHATTRHVTMLVTGGWDGLADPASVAPSDPGAVDQRDDTGALPEQAEVVDVAPTVGWLLGVPDPGGADPQWEGRVLDEAFARRPAPACVTSAEDFGPDASGDGASEASDSSDPSGGSAASDGAGDATVAAGAATRTLPATGGGAGIAALAALALGAALRRRTGA